MSHPISTMPYPDRFHVAARHVQPQLEANSSLSNEIKLALYALHQQATLGPCTQPKPWGWNAANNARWQAWKELGDLSQMEAMRLYVRTLDEEAPGWHADLSEDDLRADGVAEGAGLNGEAESSSSGPVAKTRSVAEVVVEGSWVSPFIASSRRPPPRYEHAVALLGSKMVVLGGCFSGRYLCDAWALDLETLGWSPIAPSERERALPPLAGLAAVAYGAGVVLDIASGCWTELETSWAPEKAEADDDDEEESDARPLPAPRGGHTAVLIGGSLWLFGGEDVSRRPLNELLVLDLASRTWRAPATTGSAPPPRTAHVAAVWRERYMLVFGGGSVAHCFDDLYVLDTLTLRWSRPATEGPAPPPRAGHAGAILGASWYVIGGGNNAAGCNDMYSLDVSALGARSDPDAEDAVALTWSLVGRTPPESAVASEGLSLLPVPMAGCLVAFGGYNGRYNAAVHVYRPEGYVVVKGHGGGGAAALESAASIPAARAGASDPPPPAAAAAASQELAASRREALVSRESASQELAVTRRQLAAELEAERGRAIKLEVEGAELRAELSRRAETPQQQEAKPRSLWGFISGADANGPDADRA
ncbi:hypothetical protein QBZ16_003138 [Prototheca wickerhamii]|uniref:ACB domain-containing protein n=1 Tax=Prototheca wickerhamii TaxID=3111 RepID=A0AAD9IJ99_PROWI|nr:hypothetical protein QBZ16_003138 [Prototheca wickerhamii]